MRASLGVILAALTVIPLVSGTTLGTKVDQSKGANIAGAGVPSQTIYPVQASAKIDCHPLPNVNKEICFNLGCVWAPVAENFSKFDDKTYFNWKEEENTQETPISIVREPWCYMPGDRVGYKVKQIRNNGKDITMVLHRQSGVPNDIKHVRIITEDINDDSIRIKIFNEDKTRFEPALPELDVNSIDKPTDLKFKVRLYPPNYAEGLWEARKDDNLRFQVFRTDTSAIVFDTDLSKLIFADQFIQINTKTETSVVFGLGDHFEKFAKKLDTYKAYTFFNLDQLPKPIGQRSYSSFPFFIGLDSNNTKAHGIYLHNSNAMDIILQPDKSITYRTIGGVLDFFIFSGPSPIDVTKQYQKLTGLPALPPRWALGFHLSRYGYNSTKETERVWQSLRDAKIPFDVQWNDIDYMDEHNDFTVSKTTFADLPAFVKKVHSANMRYVMILDPGVSNEDGYRPYKLGVEMDIFVKNATNQILIGQVWNDHNETVFPDFTHTRASEFWSTLFKEFHDIIPFDGAWIDMNDISNFHVDGSIHGCPKNNSLEDPPYVPGGLALRKTTLCMTAKYHAGVEYNLHNLYSFYEAIATYKALKAIKPNERPFVLSRSNAPGQNKYSNGWSGDVLSTWDHLKWSIPSLLDHSMFGHAIFGADICGFTRETTEELCARWSTLGAFYSFTRNHNDISNKDQDPVAMGKIVVEANRNALIERYSLLAYLYTLVHKAHRFGEPYARSMALTNLQDSHALDAELQFMVGESLLVAPIVQKETTNKSVYLPVGRWYQTDIKRDSANNIKEPKIINVADQGNWTTFTDIDLTNLLLFWKAGSIVPVYSKPALTTVEIVNQPLTLHVYLSQNDTASGDIYLDDGLTDDSSTYDHLTMQTYNNHIVVNMTNSNYQGEAKIQNINVFGLMSKQKVWEATENGQDIAFVHKGNTLSLTMKLGLVSKSRTLRVAWA